IKSAFNRWEGTHQTFCEIDFTYLDTTSSNRFSGSDNKNLVFWVEDGWSYGSSALAVTLCTYYVDSGRLVDCDVGFNGQDFTWTTADTGGSQNIREVLTHEIGHFWGLDHSSQQTATMYAYYQPRYLIADLDFDDIQGAYDRFCQGSLESDDELEPNDSLLTAVRIDAGRSYAGLKLYDHDVYKLSVHSGDVLGVAIEDASSRVKGVRLYDGNRLLLDQRTCTGSCTAFFGEISGATTVYLKIYGAFDSHSIKADDYGFALYIDADPADDNAAPGAPYDVEDDSGSSDDDDNDDGSRQTSDDASGWCG
ncbi:MAG: matrixin family metalloprotease, partial [Candidatus Alcyoniella australis]|nr:matrixin family metalloprotease [Candidatus Alcyoniella australis]